MYREILRPHLPRILGLSALSIVNVATILGTPLIYQALFWWLLPKYSDSLFFQIIGSIGILCILSVIINAIMYAQLMKIYTESLLKIRKDLLGDFLDFSYLFFQKANLGDVIGVFGADLIDLVTVAKNIVKLFLAALQVLTLLVALLFFVDWKIYLVAVVTIILNFLWILLFRTRSIRYDELALDARKCMYSYCYEIFPQIRDIKAYGLHGNRISRLQGINEQEKMFVAKSTFFNSLASVGGSLPVRLSGIFIFIIGYLEFIAGHVSTAQICTNLIYAGIIVYPTIVLFDAFIACRPMELNRKKISAYLSVPKETSGGRDIANFTSKIVIKNLHFSYPPRDQSDPLSPILSGLNWEITSGGFYTIVGSSGAGKTTLISLLVKLFLVPEGCVFIDGVDLAHLNIRSVRSLVGLITQEPLILDDTLKRNIDPAGLRSDDELMAICRDVSLDELINRLPGGLDAMMAERGNNLSGGEKQRVMLARRIVKGNRIMILDEATSALDCQTEQSIIKTLEHLREKFGITIIAVSHRLEIARHSDTVFVLDKGRIIEKGTHEELVLASPLYKKYWDEVKDGAGAFQWTQ